VSSPSGFREIPSRDGGLGVQVQWGEKKFTDVPSVSVGYAKRNGTRGGADDIEKKKVV